MTKSLRALKLIVLSIALTALVISPTLLPSVNNVYALTLEEQLAQVQKELAAIREQKSAVKNAISNQQAQQSVYQGRVGQLRGEVESLQLSIAELELEVEEMQIGTEQIEAEVATKEEELQQKESDLSTLDDITLTRVTESYMDYRTHRKNRVDLFNVKSPNTYFRDSQYRSIIQSKTNLVMEEIKTLRDQLAADKSELEERQVVIRRNIAIVEDQKSQLEKAKQELKEKMSGYYAAISVASSQIASANSQLKNYSSQEAKKRAQAEYLKQQIFNSFKPPGNGQYVAAGKFIGNQGSTGWSTGPHLHFMVKYNGKDRNPCNYLTARVNSSEGSCGWGGGQLQWPLSGRFYYTSRYYPGGSDSRCFRYNGQWSCSSHRAIDVAHSIWNAPVYAAHGGWLYKGKDQYGALYVIICENQNCNKGFMTGYWHLSRY